MLYSYKTKLPDPRHDRIRSVKETERDERILNIVLIVVGVIVVGIMGFLFVRHAVLLNKAALEITQEEWDALGGDEWR